MQNIAIVGATGAVGREILSLLEERRFPLTTLRCFASPASKGKTVPFRGAPIVVETMETFGEIDLAFFCAGSAISREWIPRTHAYVVDSSSAFRKELPLVIPEINEERIVGKVITSPNCAATVLLMPLFTLHRKFGAKRIVAATYQAVSGAGAHLLRALQEETKAFLEGRPYDKKLPFNLYPHTSKMDPSGYVEEEIKIREETRKILEDETIQVSATCIRVPVLRAHSVAANVEFHRPFSLEEVYACLQGVPGLKLSPNATPVDSTGKDDIYCGRFRIDPSRPNTLEFWAVGDQLRKGAALNAVQIAEKMTHVLA